MEDILKGLLSYSPRSVEEVPFNMGFFDKYQFDSFIRSLDVRHDMEIISFLKGNLDFIVNRIVQNQWDCPEVLVTEKFLRNFTQVVASMEVTQSIRTASNKICYDYLTYMQDNRDNDVESCVRQLSKIVNSSYIQQLVGIGLSEDDASNLSLCRFSSLNEKTNIKRLNFVICTKDPEVMTLQMIVYIYEKFFDRVSDLFKETMWEYYTPEQEIDLGPEFLEIYSTISLAVLTIVNNMKMSDIDRIIRGYVDDWNYMGCPPTRFSLISLSADYGRIQSVVEDIMAQKIYVP